MIYEERNFISDTCSKIELQFKKLMFSFYSNLMIIFELIPFIFTDLDFNRILHESKKVS